MDTMKSIADCMHYGEFFIQYQGDLLQVDTIGDAPAEILHVQLDSLPFHLMIHQRGQRYHFELRFWENRFDTAILQEAVKEQVGEDFVPEVITFK